MNEWDEEAYQAVKDECIRQSYLHYPELYFKGWWGLYKTWKYLDKIKYSR